MINSIQLSQEDIKLIILDYYQRQGVIKDSVNFYEKVKENKDESEIYAIVSEKEFPLNLNKGIEDNKGNCEEEKSERLMSPDMMKRISVAGRPSTYARLAELNRLRQGKS